MFEQLAPWLGQRILEIGSGIGSFTRYLVGRELIVATDLNPRYLRILRNTFERHTRVEVEPLDLMAFDPAPFAGRGIDTILCLNVLEHVEDDRGALRRLHAALAPGGRLLLLVPPTSGSTARSIGPSTTTAATTRPGSRRSSRKPAFASSTRNSSTAWASWAGT